MFIFSGVTAPSAIVRVITELSAIFDSVTAWKPIMELMMASVPTPISTSPLLPPPVRPGPTLMLVMFPDAEAIVRVSFDAVIVILLPALSVTSS